MIPDSETFYVFSCNLNKNLADRIPEALAYATGISPEEPFDPYRAFKEDEDYIMESFFHRIPDFENKSPFYNITYPRSKRDQKVKLEIYIEGYDHEDTENCTNHKNEPWNDRKEFKFILDRLETRLGPLQNKTISEVSVVVSTKKFLELGDENE